MNIKYWVHDKTRVCSMTTGKENEISNIKDGYREVTIEEQEKFQKETKLLKKSKNKK